MSSLGAHDVLTTVNPGDISQMLLIISSILSIHSSSVRYGPRVSSNVAHSGGPKNMHAVTIAVNMVFS